MASQDGMRIWIRLYCRATPGTGRSCWKGGQFAARWRRGALEEFWKYSEDSRKKSKCLVFVDFREFLNFLKFLVSPQMGCKNLLRASQTLDGQHSEAGECVAFSFCNDKYWADTCSFQSYSKYDVHSSWIYLEGVMLSYGMYWFSLIFSQDMLEAVSASSRPPGVLSGSHSRLWIRDQWIRLLKQKRSIHWVATQIICSSFLQVAAICKV